ncbi:MAG: hypothetical protein HZA31_13135 [Opitutae bacterium]|nr:hypothetical protein [Opitutae bacterium]
MNKPWKIALVFTGIFVAGAVAGGFLTLRFTARKPRVMQQTIPEQQWVLGQMRRFVTELSLDEAQKGQVKPVLNRAAEEIRRLRKKNYRETMDILERTNNEILPILTEEQRTKFEDIRWLQRKRVEDLMMGAPKKPTPVNRPATPPPAAAPAPAPTPAPKS